MSESSPIKAELETIIGQKTGSIQRNSVKPIVIATKTVEEEEAQESQKEEEEAQRAAVKAIEVAFMKKRKTASSTEAAEEVVSQEGVEGDPAPVPATRRSIKKRDDPRYPSLTGSDHRGRGH